MFKNKWWIYLGFFGVLLTIFYWAISDEQPFTDAKLPVINASMPAFNFIDQNGQSFTNKKIEGKVFVTEYFFTTCKGICPKMNISMHRIYDLYKNDPDFLMLSHTCMPEIDSVALLKKYEKKMLTGKIEEQQDGSFKLIHEEKDTIASYQNKNWFFVTGDKNELYKMARQGYMIDNGKPDSTQRIEDQFIHSQFFALVDRYGRVRGIYDALIEAEVQKLIKDIPELMKEKIDHSRFLNGFSNTPN
jgi:protein SCO1/2